MASPMNKPHPKTISKLEKSSTQEPSSKVPMYSDSLNNFSKEATVYPASSTELLIWLLDQIIMKWIEFLMKI